MLRSLRGPIDPADRDSNLSDTPISTQHSIRCNIPDSLIFYRHPKYKTFRFSSFVFMTLIILPYYRPGINCKDLQINKVAVIFRLWLIFLDLMIFRTFKSVLT